MFVIIINKIRQSGLPRSLFFSFLSLKFMYIFLVLYPIIYYCSYKKKKEKKMLKNGLDISTCNLQIG